MLRWLSPWTAASGLREVTVYFLVAALFAVHPCRAEGGNMGHTCAELRSHRKGAGVEGRFARVLGARDSDLWRHLLALVVLAREAGVPVDWARLAADLRHWDHPRRYVQMDWARAFWAAEAKAIPLASGRPVDNRVPNSAPQQPTIHDVH